MRSFFSAMSGLRTNLDKIDVIADNVANVNTVAFKKSRVLFGDSFTQVLRTPSSVQPVGIQVGTGNTTTSVGASFAQGSFQRTDLQTDLAIAGDGFFVVQNGDTAEYFFTRDGAFTIDRQGQLINGNGEFLRGSVYVEGVEGAGGSADTPAVDPGAVAPGTVAGLVFGNIKIPTSFLVEEPPASGTFVADTVINFGINPDGQLTLFGSRGSSMVAGYILMTNFSNPQGLEKAGGNKYSFNRAAGDFDPPLLGDGSWGETTDTRKAGTNAFGTIQSGALELSNVDLAEQFTDMIITQRGFDANAKVVVTTDEMLQTLNNLKR